jgi:diguanylate cyclase (GGDEF)-like protein
VNVPVVQSVRVFELPRGDVNPAALAAGAASALCLPPDLISALSSQVTALPGLEQVEIPAAPTGLPAVDNLLGFAQLSGSNGKMATPRLFLLDPFATLYPEASSSYLAPDSLIARTLASSEVTVGSEGREIALPLRNGDLYGVLHLERETPFNHQERVTIGLTAALIAQTLHTALLMRRLAEAEEARAEAEARAVEADEQRFIDGLTGLKRGADVAKDLLKTQIAIAARENKNLSVLFIDLDYFKAVNDNRGHPAGDEALKKIARIMQEGSRGSDVFIRYGGDEFLVILVDTDMEGARIFAEKIREAIQGSSLATGDNDNPIVTASIGIVAAQPAHSAISAEDLINAADNAMYQAKKAGRNRVEPQPDLSPPYIPTRITSRRRRVSA